MATRRRSSWRSFKPGVPDVPDVSGMPGKDGVMPRVDSSAVRVLGLDPGSRVTGFGVLDVEGRQISYVASGAIRASSDDFTLRLHEIYQGVAQVMTQYRPGEVAIEKVFVHVNPDSALKLGQARGAAICATFQENRSTAEYTPREVKLAVTGSGAADKPQVAQMVKTLLGLQGRLQTDAADALAIALCHAHGRAARLALALGRRR